MATCCFTSLISSNPLPYQPHTYNNTYMVTLTEAPSIILVVGLPLGALLTVAFLITTVAVVIAVCIQLSRKKEKTPACAIEYEAVGPPQQLQGADTVITNMNVAYAIPHHNATHASTSFNTT